MSSWSISPLKSSYAPLNHHTSISSFFFAPQSPSKTASSNIGEFPKQFPTEISRQIPKQIPGDRANIDATGKEPKQDLSERLQQISGICIPIFWYARSAWKLQYRSLNYLHAVQKKPPIWFATSYFIGAIAAKLSSDDTNKLMLSIMFAKKSFEAVLYSLRIRHITFIFSRLASKSHREYLPPEIWDRRGGDDTLESIVIEQYNTYSRLVFELLKETWALSNTLMDMLEILRIDPAWESDARNLWVQNIHEISTITQQLVVELQLYKNELESIERYFHLKTPILELMTELDLTVKKQEFMKQVTEIVKSIKKKIVEMSENKIAQSFIEELTDFGRAYMDFQVRSSPRKETRDDEM